MLRSKRTAATREQVLMRMRIPRFRIRESVIDEEVGFALQGAVAFRGNTRIDSLHELLADGFDAVFVT